MAMEHFDEKIVPTFKANPNSPAAATAVVNACGHTPVSPSRILSGSFMSVSGSGSHYVGVPGISFPVFGTAHSTPKRQCHQFSHNTGSMPSREVYQNERPSISRASGSGVYHLEKTHLNKKLEVAIKKQRRLIKKMQKVSTLGRIIFLIFRSLRISEPKVVIIFYLNI